MQKAIVLFFLLSIFLHSYGQEWPPAKRFNMTYGQSMGNVFAMVKDANYGLVDANLNEILPYEYNNMEESGNFIIAKKKFGEVYLLDRNGKMLISTPVYYIHSVTDDGYVQYIDKAEGEYGIMDSMGKVVLQPVYGNIGYLGNKLFKVQKQAGGSWGVMNTNAELVVGDTLEDIGELSEGLLSARQKSSRKMGYLDIQTKKWAIEPQFIYAYGFDGGAALISNDSFAMSGKSNVSVKYGLIDRTGKVILEPTYALMLPFNNGNLSISKQSERGKYGAIDRSGKLVVPFIYDQIFDFTDGYASVKSGSKYGIIDNKGTVVVPLEYEQINQPQHGTRLAKKGGKFGLLSNSGKVILPVTYDLGNELLHGAGWMKKDSLYILVDPSGKTLISLNQFYLPPTHFIGNTAMVKKKTAFYLLNTKGQKILDLPYDEVGSINDGVIGVKKNYLYGFIDTRGKVICDVNKSSIIEFNDGIGAVQTSANDLPYCIDNTGKKLFTLGNYVFHGPYSEGLAKAFVNKGYYYTDNRLAYVDKAGQIVITTDYKEGGKFVNGFAIVQKITGTDTTFGLINKTGKTVISADYQNIGNMSPDGRAPLLNSAGKWGFADTAGRVVIPFKFEEASEFYEGMAVARLNGKVGVIDLNGNPVINFKYDNGQMLGSTELIILQKDTLWGAVDKKDKTKIDFKYQYLANFQDGVAWAKQNGVWGIVDAKGVWKATPDVIQAGGFSDGFAIIQNAAKKYGVIDKTGKMVVPAMFDNISNIYKDQVIVSEKEGYVKVPIR